MWLACLNRYFNNAYIHTYALTQEFPKVVTTKYQKLGVLGKKKKKEKRKNEIYCLSSETSESKLKGVGRALLFLKLSGSWAIFGVPWHIDASLQSSVFTEHSPCVCLHIISSCKNVIDID